MTKAKLFFPVLTLFFILSGCSTLNQINLYSVDDDKQLGTQMYNQIQSDTKEYPMLDETKYAKAYAQVKGIVNAILQTGLVENASSYDWTLKIINADVQNAFACPGGKIYIYTGLINYLDNEAQLAGVLAHELGHVSYRHSTRQMTKQVGVQALTSLVLGKNPGQLATLTAQVAGSLGGLAFSRSDEYEADAFAVKALSLTDYNPLGVAGFFLKLESAGEAGSATPVFLSTHPSPPDRIERIKAEWQANGSKKGNDYPDKIATLKSYLKQ